MSKTKIKEKLVIEREKKDVDRLRHMAMQIRPEVLTAAVTILQNTDLEEAAGLFKGVVKPPPLRSGYFYFVETVGGRQVARLYRNDELLASGATAEVFAYAAEEHPGAMRVMLGELQNGAVYVPLPKGGRVDVADMLLAYRTCRAKSKGLNAITKLAQLSGIEEDHPSLLFRAASHLSGENIVVLGSGALGSTHTIFEDPVTLVDPLIPYTGQGYDRQIRGSWQDVNLHDYSVVVSDVASGDVTGMKGGTFIPEGLDSVVYTKLDLASPTGPPGRVVRKPRPHNTEVIWEIDYGGETWERQVDGLRQQVIQANEARMLKFFSLEGTARVMPYAYSTQRIKNLFDRCYKIPPFKAKLIKKPDSITPRFEGLRRRLSRFERFTEAMMKFSQYQLEEEARIMSSFCLLGKERMAEGGAARLDPGFGTVQFAVRSVLLSAIHHGYKPVKTGGGWLLTK